MDFNGMDWNSMEFNGMGCVLEFNGMECARTGMSVGMRWSVWWEVLGQCAGKHRAENRDTCCDIETFISEETFAFFCIFAFFAFFAFGWVPQSQPFPPKISCSFQWYILDSFSTSGRGCTR